MDNTLAPRNIQTLVHFGGEPRLSNTALQEMLRREQALATREIRMHHTNIRLLSAPIQMLIGRLESERWCVRNCGGYDLVVPNAEVMLLRDRWREVHDLSRWERLQ